MNATPPRRNESRGPGLVLALGAGGAAGVAHVGVLQVLAEQGLAVRAVTGASIGAEIGAFLASGMSAAEITALATGFDWKQTLQLFLPDLPAGGLVSGRNIVEFLDECLGGARIEDFPLGYAAVATDLERGEQVVLDRGSAVDAVRASISIPGLMAPPEQDGRLLVDGGVVNPLPVDVALARFGRPLVAVAIDEASQRRSRLPQASVQWAGRLAHLLDQPWAREAPLLRAWLEQQSTPTNRHSRAQDWSSLRVLERSLAITRLELVRQRLAQAPPDLTLTPAVEDIGVLEFYRAEEAIEAGRQTALAAAPTLRRLLAGQETP